MSTEKVQPEEERYRRAELQERYRRLEYVLEEHPLLSGLMTDEFKFHLRCIAEGHFRSIPEGEPSFESELGFDPLPLE